MKKIYTLLSFGVLAAFGLHARTLTPEEALGRLESDRSASRIAATAAATPRLVHTSFSEAGVPAAYVFDRSAGHGFMVLSADDVATPLLGYGDADVTDATGMPPQLVWWLGEYAKEIEAAAAQGAPEYVNLSSFDAPAAAGDGRSPIAPLLSTLWNQDAPYNNLCPKSGLRTTYTGCVATAMAQVMKYHNYPDKGTGTGSCTVSNSYGVQISTDQMDLGVTLDWADMLDDYSGNYTAAQATAVATLMKVCGYAVNMDYGTSASGAQSWPVAKSLVDNFGYDKAIEYRERIMYPLSTWEDMVYENLKTCGPVYYSGQALAGGHAFVCDGYSTDRYFHFNWGWSGAYNGYFRLTALEPAGQGIGGFAGGYNSEQAAIFGIRKPVAGSELPVGQLTQTTVISATSDASRVTIAGSWFNLTPRDMNVAIAVELTPVNGGTPKAIQLYTYSECPSFKGFSSWIVKKSSLATVADGQYKLAIITQNEGETEWLGVLHPINVPDYILMTKAGGTLTFTTQNAAALTCVSAELITPVYYDCAGKIEMEFRNDNDVEVPCNVALGMLNGSNVVARTDGMFVDLVPGESQKMEMEYTFSTSSDFSKGSTYTLVLFDTNTGSVIKNFGSVKASAAPEATLACDNFKMVGHNLAAVLDNLHFRGTFSNNSTGYYGNFLGIAMFNESGGQSLGSFEGSNVYLQAGETVTTDFNIDFSSIGEINTYYLAVPFYLKMTIAGIPAAEPFDGDPVLRFRATVVSGIEAVPDDEAELRVYYNNVLRSAIVNSGVEIAGVEVYSAAGAMLYAPVSKDGCSATVDLSAAPAGMAVVRATDAAGNSVATKIMIR